MISESATKLYEFFTGFGIKAYEEHTVPDTAKLPYITYSLAFPDWRDSASISASVWYSGTKLKELLNKVDEISRKIGEGLMMPVETGGCIYLSKENPFSQMIPTENDNVKAVTLNIGLQNICN